MQRCVQVYLLLLFLLLLIRTLSPDHPRPRPSCPRLMSINTIKEIKGFHHVCLSLCTHQKITLFSHSPLKLDWGLSRRNPFLRNEVPQELRMSQSWEQVRRVEQLKFLLVFPFNTKSFNEMISKWPKPISVHFRACSFEFFHFLLLRLLLVCFHDDNPSGACKFLF